MLKKENSNYNTSQYSLIHSTLYTLYSTLYTLHFTCKNARLLEVVH